MTTLENQSAVHKPVDGEALFASDTGDLWSIDMRGEMPGNVATTTRFVFRQGEDFGQDQNPAEDLLNAFFVAADSPFSKLKAMLATSFTAVCAVVTNLDDAKAFVQVFNIVDGSGDIIDVGVLSTYAVVRLKYADELGRLQARKSIYVPGIAKSQIADSRLTTTGEFRFKVFVDSLRLLNGAVSPWHWSYETDPTKPQADARNGHSACFVSSLRSRRPSVC